MRRIFRALTALFLCLFLLLTAPFSFLSNIVSADDGQQYAFAGATDENIGYVVVDDVYFPFEGFFFCANLDRDGPNTTGTNRFTMSRLSDTSLSAEQKSRIVAIQQNGSYLESMVTAYATANPGTAAEALYNDCIASGGSESGQHYLEQYLIWITLDEGMFKTLTGSSHSYIGLQGRYGDATDTAYDDPASLWQTVFKPALDYIDTLDPTTTYPVGKSQGQYDALYFISADTSVQNTLGMATTAINDQRQSASVTIQKNLSINSPYITFDDVDGTKIVIYKTSGELVGSYDLSQFTKISETTTAAGTDYVYELTIPNLTNETYIVTEIPQVPDHTILGGNSRTTVSLQPGDNTAVLSNIYTAEDLSCRLIKCIPFAVFYDADGNPVDLYTYFYPNTVIRFYVDDGTGIVPLSIPNNNGDPCTSVSLRDLSEDPYYYQDGYYFSTESLDTCPTDFSIIDIPDDPNLHYYLSETGAEAPGYGLTAYVGNNTAVWNDDYQCYMFDLGTGGELHHSNLILTDYYNETSSLVVTKKASGDLATSGLNGVTFTVTGSDGSLVGTYTIGSAQFPYDSTNDCYRLEITGLDPSLTYTVAESSYDVDGYSVESQYVVDGGTAVSGTSASGIALTGGTATTVAFTNTYTSNPDPTTAPSEPTSETTSESTAESSTETTSQETPSSDGGASSAGTSGTTETSQTTQTTETTGAVDAATANQADNTDEDNAGRDMDSTSVIPETGEAYDLILIGSVMIVSSPLAFYGSTKFKDRRKK